MRALHFTEFGPVSNLRLIELPAPKADATTAIVKIAAASITPSDVKNVEGSMAHTTLPRVPAATMRARSSRVRPMAWHRSLGNRR